MRRLISLLLLICLMTSTALAQTDTLSEGSRGAAVKTLQQRLITLKFLSGGADGIYGRQTSQAVQRFQQHLQEQGYQITADGIAGAETLRLVYDDEAAGDLLNLKSGDSGTRVRELQGQLYDLHLLDSLPDGVYGANTAQAVREFQGLLVQSGIAGATQSGVADALTRKYLAGDMKALSIPLPQNFDDEQPANLTADHLYAKAAILIDAGTGQLLLQKEANTRMYPASTTKILTALLALEKMDIEDLVTLPKETNDTPANSSLVPVYWGEKMSMKDLLHGLMLRSGNDAANAIAVLHSGSTEAFAQVMNTKAQALGMQGSHFTNAHGYHDQEHYTTAADLARLALAALRNEHFRQIISVTDYTLQKTSLRKELPIKVSTEMLDPQSPFYYKEAFGIKSGYTSAAGFCYVGAAQKDGRLLLAVVLNDRTRNQAWTDMARLFNLGFAK